MSNNYAYNYVRIYDRYGYIYIYIYRPKLD